MADAYDFEDTGDAESLARYAQKLCSNLKSRDSVVKFLKLIAQSLEALPQDVASLGSAKQSLEEVLIDKNVLNSKHKDVKIYAGTCMAHMLRIYAPETPYAEQYLEPIFDLLLFSVQQIADFQSPMFETALTVVQTINQTKSYFLLLDMGREDMLLDWVRALLGCINAGSSAMAGPHIMELLQGLVGDESTSEAVLEVLLSYLVPPRSIENPHACQVAQAVLKGCEGDIKPQLQKFLTTLILSPISSDSDLHQQSYALIYQLYQSVPHVLLPVVPHFTSELQSGDGNKRLEAVQLLCKLFSLPGSKLVTEYEDVLEALLGRYQDTKIEVRLTMLESTTALVAGVGTEELQQRVLKTAATRLQDFEEKVRTAAVKAVCQTSRRLLVGPTPAAPGSTGGAAANRANQLVLTTPPADLLGQLGSEADDLAAAAELGVDYTPPETTAVGLNGSGPEAQVRDLAFVQDVLQRVSLRLRDTKPSVRKAAADRLMSVFRAVAAAGDAEHLAKVCWLPNRILLCMKSDVELRTHMFEVAMKDGLLGPPATAAQTAAAWIRLWVAASQLEKEALMLLLHQRTRTQGAALAFVALRRKTSGKEKDDSDSTKQQLQVAAKRLAQSLPQPDRALEGLNALMAVRDNHVFAELQQALAPDASPQAFAKARSEALARVGSRSPAADFISQLLLWARPAAWLPPPVLSALLELVADDPSGQQGELVREAYDLLQKLAKNTAMLFSGLLPQLLDLLRSQWTDLQQLGAVLVARCFVQQRKLGLTPAAKSADAATAKLVKEQLLPCLRQLARGKSSSGAAAAAPAGGQKRRQQQQGRRQQRRRGKQSQEEQEEEEQSDAEDQQNGDLHVDLTPTAATDGVAAPKASKWAVYALATCQDSTSCKKELTNLADELAGSLDSSEAETAGKLQALSAVGRLLPEVFGRHVEALMAFVLDDYLLSYLDASITNATGITSSQHSRSPLAKVPGEASLGSQLTGSQAPGAAAVWLKAAAVKALAAGCVPDGDSHDVPVETMSAVARLTQDLEGYLEPSEDARPEFLADVSREVAGILRLASASALLRLARRHDSRITPSCYCMLSLVMQDDLEGVRAVFSAKVFKLMRHFQMRPSTHQLGAKYAAMLPLSAMDPSRPNKETAARQLREWVHSRRAVVQQNITAAAAAAADGGAKGGGSTLQDLPEMILPYGLYILAHHPDLPQDEDAEDVTCYNPFQFMLQFMLQPLLVASGGTPAGATVPALVKMCRFLKRTADTSDEPCTEQLYVLCDLSIATVKGLVEHMGISRDVLSGHYPGSVTLPKGLYRPLEKDERGADDISYLPQDFQVVFDPEPATALAQAPGQATPAAGRGRPAGTGRGSKHRAQQKIAAAAGADNDEPSEQKRAGRGGRSKQGSGRKAARKAAPVESDDGWDDNQGVSDEEASQEAAKDQQLTKRQQLLQQQRQHKQQPAARKSSPVAADDDSDSESGSEGHSPEPQQQQPAKKQQQRSQQKQQKQQPVHSSGQQQEDAGDSQPDGAAAAAEPKQQQQRRRSAGQQQQQKGSKLKQQPLASAFQQAAVQHAVADASSPAPVRKPKPQADALLSRKRPAKVEAAESEGRSSGGDSASADAADSPAATAHVKVTSQQQHANGIADFGSGDSQGDIAAAAHKQQARGASARGKAAGKGATAAVNGAAGRGKQQAAAGAAAKRPRSAPADKQPQEDTAMPDQEVPATTGKGRAAGRASRTSGAAAEGAEGGKGSKAGVKRAAAEKPAAAAGSGRSTRRRVA